MIDVFTPKKIYPDCLFQSNHRQVKISILIPWCGIYLRCMLQTVEIVSKVCCTPLKKSGSRKSRDTLPLNDFSYSGVQPVWSSATVCPAIKSPEQQHLGGVTLSHQ